MTALWGWEKRGIWAEPKWGQDGKEAVVWFGAEMAVTIKIEENKIVISYGKDWEQYLQNKKHPGFAELVAGLEVKLQASKENISKKGTGKGKPGKRS